MLTVEKWRSAYRTKQGRQPRRSCLSRNETMRVHCMRLLKQAASGVTSLAMCGILSHIWHAGGLGVRHTTTNSAKQNCATIHRLARAGYKTIRACTCISARIVSEICPAQSSSFLFFIYIFVFIVVLIAISISILQVQFQTWKPRSSPRSCVAFTLRGNGSINQPSTATTAFRQRNHRSLQPKSPLRREWNEYQRINVSTSSPDLLD